MGAAMLWQHRHRLVARVVGAAAIVVTAVWAYVASRPHPGLRPVAADPLVLVAGVLGRRRASWPHPAVPGLTGRLTVAALGLGLVAGLSGPMAYTATTVDHRPHRRAFRPPGPTVGSGRLGGGPGGAGGGAGAVPGGAPAAAGAPGGPAARFGWVPGRRRGSPPVRWHATGSHTARRRRRRVRWPAGRLAGGCGTVPCGRWCGGARWRRATTDAALTRPCVRRRLLPVGGRHVRIPVGGHPGAGLRTSR